MTSSLTSKRSSKFNFSLIPFEGRDLQRIIHIECVYVCIGYVEDIPMTVDGNGPEAEGFIKFAHCKTLASARTLLGVHNHVHIQICEEPSSFAAHRCKRYQRFSWRGKAPPHYMIPAEASSVAVSTYRLLLPIPDEDVRTESSSIAKPFDEDVLVETSEAPTEVVKSVASVDIN